MSVCSAAYPVLLQNGRLRYSRIDAKNLSKMKSGKLRRENGENKKDFDFCLLLWIENGNGNDFGVCGMWHVCLLLVTYSIQRKIFITYVLQTSPGTVPCTLLLLPEEIFQRKERFKNRLVIILSERLLNHLASNGFYFI